MSSVTVYKCSEVKHIKKQLSNFKHVKHVRTAFLWTYQAHDFMKHAKLDIFWSMPNKWSTPFHKAQQARKHAKFIEQVGMSSAPITWARKDASMLSTQHARMPFSRLNLDILFAFNIKKARLLSSYLHFWYFDFRL